MTTQWKESLYSAIESKVLAVCHYLLILIFLFNLRNQVAKAAVKLQAIFRGLKARKQVKAMRSKWRSQKNIVSAVRQFSISSPKAGRRLSSDVNAGMPAGRKQSSPLPPHHEGSLVRHSVVRHLDADDSLTTGTAINPAAIQEHVNDILADPHAPSHATSRPTNSDPISDAVPKNDTSLFVAVSPASNIPVHVMDPTPPAAENPMHSIPEGTEFKITARRISLDDIKSSSTITPDSNDLDTFSSSVSQFRRVSIDNASQSSVTSGISDDDKGKNTNSSTNFEAIPSRTLLLVPASGEDDRSVSPSVRAYLTNFISLIITLAETPAKAASGSKPSAASIK